MGGGGGEIETDNDSLIQHPHQRCVHGAAYGPAGRSWRGQRRNRPDQRRVEVVGAPGVAGHSFASQITSAYLAAANPDGVLMLRFGVYLMFICVFAAG